MKNPWSHIDTFEGWTVLTETIVIFHIKFWHLVFKLGSKKVKFLLKGWRNSPRSPRQISLILFLFPRTNSFCLLQWDEVIFKLHSWQEWGGFYFRSTNSNSYESWHLQLKFYTLLRLTRLKLQPRWSQQHLQPYIIKKLPDPNGWLIPSTKMVHFCGVRPVEATICYFF